MWRVRHARGADLPRGLPARGDRAPHVLRDGAVLAHADRASYYLRVRVAVCSRAMPVW